MSTHYSESTSSVNCSDEKHTEQSSQNLTTSSSSFENDTPLSNGGKTRITCPLRVVNGLDFLKVSFWLNWGNSQLFDELEKLKALVQQTEDQSIPHHVIGGFDWNLHRTGTSHYSFRLTSGDLTLLFNKRQSDGVIPTARLEIGSVSCWSPGWFSIYERILEWFEFLGAIVVKEKVSEVHLAADFVGLDINTIKIENEDRWITSAHHFNIHRDRRRFSGVSLGKDALMLRIYDKVLELKKSTSKQIVFSDVWDVFPYDQHPVTRVEFQLRRKVINEFEQKISTVKELIAGLQSLWNYCTHNWARFCDTKVNRNHNQSKSQNSDFWIAASQIDWSGTHEIRRKKRQQNKNLDQILDNLAGLAMCVSAFYDPNPGDIDHIVGIPQKLIENEPTHEI